MRSEGFHPQPQMQPRKVEGCPPAADQASRRLTFLRHAIQGVRLTSGIGATRTSQDVSLSRDHMGGVTGSIDTDVKPGQDTYIRVFTVAPGKPAPAGAMSVDEVIRFVGGRVKKPT